MTRKSRLAKLQKQIRRHIRFRSPAKPHKPGSPAEFVESLRLVADPTLKLMDASGLRTRQAAIKALQAADLEWIRSIDIPPKKRMSAADAMLIAALFGSAMVRLRPRLAEILQGAQMHGARGGVFSTADQVARFDLEAGVSRVLAAPTISQSATMILQGRNQLAVTSFLTRRRRMMVRSLQSSLATGKPVGAAVTVATSTASFYAARRDFERTLRSELAYGWNHSSMDYMGRAGVPMKKILAVMDKRTAYDSIAVHGQVRPLDGLFLDGAGRSYSYPPARPNDREIVVGWDDRWSENSATRPLSEGSVEGLMQANKEYQRGYYRQRRASNKRLSDADAKNVVRKLK